MEKDEGDPFALIEKGNALAAASNHWAAADLYSQAATCLASRADNLSSQQVDDNVKNQERRKIISLYRAQSLEYLYKARHCFIEAIKFENDQDRNRMLEVAKSGKGRLDPLCSMLSSEESERRRCIFQTLFSKEDEVKAKEVVQDEGGKRKDVNKTDETAIPDAQNDVMNECTIKPAEDIDNLQESMEARLAKLNSSLANNEHIPKAPPPFISGSRSGGASTDQSRLDSLQRGLEGLGVTLPDNSSNKVFVSDNLSDEEQVKLIIQQAQDEVMMEKKNTDADKTLYTCDAEDEIDENDSMFDGFEDEEDDIESLLAKAENLVVKATSDIKKGGVDRPSSSSQSSAIELAQIRKAQALLLEARLLLEMRDGNKEETDDQSNKTNSVGIKAKERVKDANECLKNILSDWKD